MNRLAAVMLAAGVMAVSVGVFVMMGSGRKAMISPAATITKEIIHSSGVTGEKGSGKIIEETRSVGAFTAIEAQGAIKLVVTDDAAPLKVSIDDNLARLFSTKVNGGRLVLEWTGSANPSQKVVVSVGSKNLEGLILGGATEAVVPVTSTAKFELQASGASEAEIKSLAQNVKINLSGASKGEFEAGKAKEVTVDCSGASELKLDGEGQELSAMASGGSNIDSDGAFKAIVVNASGASNIEVKALESLTGQASGASEVVGHGAPSVFNVQSSGASEATLRP